MQKSSRFIFVAIVFVAVITACIYIQRIRTSGKNVCRDCNVILITVDSLNPSHLGLYGYARNTSPNIDAWAKSAVVFDQYITTSDLTPITQTSLQTGLYPSHNGVVSFSSVLPKEVPTLPEVLKKAGYLTAAYGSAPEYFEAGVSGWQQRRENYKRGFDEFFDEYFENQIMPLPATDAAAYRWPQQERGLPRGVIDWLTNAPKQKFFLWMPIGTVHWPYNDTKPTHFADTGYQGMLKNDRMHWQLPSQFKRIYNGKFWPEIGDPIPLTPADTQFIVDRYDDGIYLTDQFLGDVFRTLKEQNLMRNTIVILTTEHGEEFGEHGYIAHYDIFDPEIRVPLIIYSPELPSKKVTQQVSTVDILPSLMDAVGLVGPENLDGKSFWDALWSKQGLAAKFRPYAFTERTPLMETLMFDSKSFDEEWLRDFLQDDGNKHYRDVGVRTAEWKLIYRESGKIQEKYSWWRRLSGDTSPIADYELYRLSGTQPEQKNVIDEYPQVAADMKKVLHEWIVDGEEKRSMIPPDLEEINLGTRKQR